MTMIAPALSMCAVRFLLSSSSSSPIINPDRLLLETGFYVLMEDGNYIALE